MNIAFLAFDTASLHRAVCVFVVVRKRKRTKEEAIEYSRIRQDSRVSQINQRLWNHNFYSFDEVDFCDWIGQRMLSQAWEVSYHNKTREECHCVPARVCSYGAGRGRFFLSDVLFLEYVMRPTQTLNL